MPERHVSDTLGEYYRDLSLNYDLYTSGQKPWPERPDCWYDPLGYIPELSENLEPGY